MSFKYVKILVVLLVMFGYMDVKASSCTSSEESRLYKLASNVKVNYQDYEYYNEFFDKTVVKFDILVTGISKELYVKFSYDGEDTILKSKDDVSTIKDIRSGTYKLYVYALNSECKGVIRTINLVIPKYNEYYYHELCQGISAKDFPLCGKWYQGNTTYATFYSKVTSYRESLKDSKPKVEEKVIKEDKVWYQVIYSFVVSYYLYIIPVLGLLLGVIIVLVVKKRKRSEF